MEGWRQRRLGSTLRNPQEGRGKTDLTLTGLLMEGTDGAAVIGERQNARIGLYASFSTLEQLILCREGSSIKML
jgi:hypothetical protein